MVTVEAFAPFRAAWTRDAADPQPLPYLDYPSLREQSAFDIELEVLLQTERCAPTAPPQRLSFSNFRHSYWAVAQMSGVHHTVNGCNLQAGDFLGSGYTVWLRPEGSRFFA